MDTKTLCKRRSVRLILVSLIYKLIRMEKENKTKDIHLRLTQAEFIQIQKDAKATQSSVSEYMRICSLNKKIISKTDMETVFQIRRIGANFNQLVKSLNANSSNYNVEDTLNSLNFYYKEFKKIIDILK